MEPEFISLLQTLLTLKTFNVLFVGETGSGKTTIIQAVIQDYFALASATAMVKVKTCTRLLIADNILHINNLNEQGITYYRNELKTFCQTASTIPGKKKIVILDDLDLINEQGQQVFRNCIDKHSHNVHFLASCTNLQNVIDSLQSRLNILPLKLISLPRMRHLVEHVCLEEHIHLEPDALDFMLSIRGNSVCTVLNYLEKFKLLKSTITLEVAIAACTNISFHAYARFTTLCKVDDDLVGAMQVLFELYECGYSVMDILDNYFMFVKITDLLTEDEKYAIVPLLCKYITIFHTIHEDKIELALFTNNLVRLFQQGA
jgi:DNA polymerase III delta prime subunit